MVVSGEIERLAAAWVGGSERVAHWLVLDGVDLGRAQRAVARANEPGGDPLSEEDIGGAVAPVSGGTAVVLLHCEDLQMVRGWLGRLAECLEEMGCALRVRLEERAWDGPSDFAEDRAVPTGFFAWRLHDPPLARPDWREHWGVDASLTAWVMRRAAAWSRDIAGETTLELLGGPDFSVDPFAEDLVEDLTSAIDVSRHVALRVRPRGGGAGGRIGFGMGGISIMQLTGPADRHDTVRALREELVAVAGHLRWGAIRLGSDGVVDVGGGLYGEVGLPGGLTGGTQVARAGRLLREWVPDAHAVQVLSEGHMRKLRLSSERWRTTRLRGGRSLVEARDLDPWFAGSRVREDVLTEVRQEFSPAQLTAETLLAARRSGPLI